MIDINKIAEQLKVDEGYRGKVYQCSAGKLTIGYGYNMEDNYMSERIAGLLLDDEIGKTIASCERFDWWHKLSPVRKGVIINMTYNLGWVGVSKFKKMIAAIKLNAFNEAANQMLDSKWHTQVGARAERLAEEMRSDQA